MGHASGKTPLVAVLMGGTSAEREVSLPCGRACATALRGEGYEVVGQQAGPDLGEGLRGFSPDMVIDPRRMGEDAACSR